MIIQSARAAFSQLLTPPLRGVFLKSIGLTLALLVGAWFGVSWLFEWLALPWLDARLSLPDWASWLGTFGTVLAGLVLALALAFLIAPVTALVAGLFLDDVAEVVERTDYPGDAPGRPVPFLEALWNSLQFLGVVILGNMLALTLLLVPVVNAAAFFLVNGYLLGREFFEFAATRHLPKREARALRRRNRGTVFAAGLVIAAFLAVPVLNLLTPLFAAAMMVHLYKAVADAETRGRR
jgi:CysZ protein